MNGILSEEQEKELSLVQVVAMTVVQQLIALILVLGLTYQVVVKYEAPYEGFVSLVSLAVGFYFGSKKQ